ncbi:S-adenosyl-L-methionine-dependent methyltransferase [Plenodomus tracheiphilus IPT5]|uniref:S-adenosyl-L-methionine-dependent methyltransferase n=1 Tax=Plenodomus tracheiphilus IPT5 TaxID=1408161 RepID=A0A6A7AWF3_9PLEO|nr:S-adenosyl-L-methionine-dependent methyltransferase [Plenodomus tracheiphilus IPT5]
MSTPSATPNANANANAKPKDWSATQYLKFDNERTRAVRDLVARIQPLVKNDGPRIYDLGCGPGNSTAVLAEAWAGARITGVDGSKDMLEKARARFPSQSTPNSAKIDFTQGDISTFDMSASTPDLIFSNAVFHWLRTPTRIATLTRIFSALEPNAVLALQVPDNYNAPSHTLMRETALLSNKPWSPYFHSTQIGDLNEKNRPDLDPIEPPETWFNALAPLASAGGGAVDVWRTEYMHILPDAKAIVEWVKGTGLQPFLHVIEGNGGGGREDLAEREEAKKAFLEEYGRRIGEAYEGVEGGRVMLGYRRLFVVAVRGEGV